MTDFSGWEVYSGAFEGSGRSEKIWLHNTETNQMGLFKFKKDIYTTDHISECIAYELACLLNIECAKFELGIYNGREGSMSYNILKDEKQSLVEGLSYIIRRYPEYDTSRLEVKTTKEVYSLEMIREALPENIAFKDFLKIPLFDYLIGNTDRHQNNWAFIVENESVRLSPLYDNSSSLCAYLREEELDVCLGNDKLKWKSVVETKSKSIIRRTLYESKRPMHLEVLQYIRENYYTETREIVSRFINCITEQNIARILRKFNDDNLPQKKKQVISKFLREKINKMQEVYIERKV